MPAKNSFTFPLNELQQEALLNILRTGNFRPTPVEHTRYAVEGDHVRIALYKSGKCLVQGAGAADFVTFTLEPLVLLEARLGYEDTHNPEALQPHIGVDESGKGDFFGPLVIAAVYVDTPLVKVFREMGVRDSKNIQSDDKIRELSRAIRERVGARHAVISIGPRKYNELYAKIRNVNRLLAWGHARAIENVLIHAPDCTRALSDQFGAKHLIERALLQRGKKITLEQRHKAESDMAVAAASILARDRFVAALGELSERYGTKIPKGASVQVRETAIRLVRDKQPTVLLDTVKCHFKTTDEVLAAAGSSRAVLGPDGAARPAAAPPFKPAAP